MDLEQDFDLQILKAGDHYRINVLQSPAGEADGEFTLPFSDIEVNDLFRGLGYARSGTRGGASPEVANAREFGTRLFDKVFSGDVRDCLNSSRGSARAAGANLRIRLRLTKVPELLNLPWELLFDRRHNRFIALDGSTTLVRHLPVAEPVIPMRVEPPLSVLVPISNPRGDLNVEQEWAKLSQALADVISRGLIKLERLHLATFESLQSRLTAGSIHVLHFIGHGYYDSMSQNGYLSFETEASGERRVGAARLADLLRPHRTLRLVVLNACEGGRTSREDPFAGVAQSLVQSAIPAVVAMQFPVTDAAAITFAGAFYGGFAGGRPVDLALAAARRAVNLSGEEGDIEWATPVLYMRSDGRLFDLGASEPVQAPKPPLTRPLKVGSTFQTHTSESITRENEKVEISTFRRIQEHWPILLGVTSIPIAVVLLVAQSMKSPVETMGSSQAAGETVAQAVPPTPNPVFLMSDVISVGKRMLSSLDKTRNTSTGFDYWPDGGIRIGYYHLATFGTYQALAELSPYPIFLSGPHGDDLSLDAPYSFGRYNPEFLHWIHEHLLAILQEPAFVQSTKPNFEKYLGKTARVYLDTYTTLNSYPSELNVLLQDYKSRIEQKTLPAGYFYGIAWDGDPNRFQSLKALRDAHDPNVVAPAVYFWLRRHIDGTHEKVFAMLESLLTAYGLTKPGLYVPPSVR